MLSISTNFATPDTDLLSQFDDELEESGRLPYLQVIHAGSKNAKALDKDDLSYGLAITAENAEAVGFNTAAWVEGEDIAIHPLTQATIEHGWVGRTVNMVPIAISELEVQQKINDQWRFAGLAYEGGKVTRWGELCAEETGDDKQYRKVRRWLVILLGDDLTPLHERPLQLTSRGAFGASLSQEYFDFQAELGQAYRKGAKAAGRSVKGGRFTKSAQAFTIFPARIGYNIPEAKDRSAFTCIVERLQPVADAAEVGHTSEIKRGDRVVKVTGCHYSQLMISRGSELGQMVASLTAEFEDFGKPNRGRAEGGDQAVAFSGQGHLDASTLEYRNDGSVAVVLDTGVDRVPVVIPANWADRAVDAQGEVMIDGFIPADGGPVEVSRVAVVEVSAPVAAGQVPVGVSF
jgi:hypothetical protein